MLECSIAKTVDCEDGLHPRVKQVTNNNNNMADKKMATGFQKNMEGFVNIDNISNDATVLQRFYAGSNVLVTGATGFMGKVLIEKLLRSCPDLENIYMIVRDKKGRSLDERIDDLVSSPCFDRIKQEYPKFRSKLKAVGGDIGLPGLGISDSDIARLQQHVDIVFHVAATVRFDEQLTDAIFLNVRGTREILSLSRTFKKLRCMIHVSTAYANCPSQHIEERCFKSPLGGEQAIRIAETLEPAMLTQLAPKLVGTWPNTYAYTKALSEDVVKTNSQDLPVGIFRPAIVISTKSEPMPGWIDNLHGPSGVIAGVASGLLRTMQFESANEANVVPCDMAINGLIASAWDVAENRTSDGISVYNYVSPSDNPITWGELLDIYLLHGKNYPTSRAIWYWTLTSASSRVIYLIYRFFLHFLPALLIDMVLLVTNKKPGTILLYKKIHKFLDLIAYFCNNQWKFDDGNVTALWQKLGHPDQNLFFFDMRSLNWEEYIKDTCPGIRTYLLKDSMETLPAAKIRMQRLYILHRFAQFVLAGLFVWLSVVSLSAILSSYSISYLETLPVKK